MIKVNKLSKGHGEILLFCSQISAGSLLLRPQYLLICLSFLLHQSMPLCYCLILYVYIVSGRFVSLFMRHHGILLWNIFCEV